MGLHLPLLLKLGNKGEPQCIRPNHTLKLRKVTKLEKIVAVSNIILQTCHADFTAPHCFFTLHEILDVFSVV